MDNGRRLAAWLRKRAGVSDVTVTSTGPSKYRARFRCIAAEYLDLRIDVDRFASNLGVSVDLDVRLKRSN